MTEAGLPSLSPKERVILELLLRAPTPLYGLELVRQSDQAITRGAVYVMLGRMGDKGLIESDAALPDPTQSGLPRRRYRISGLGERVLMAARSRERCTTLITPRPVFG